MPSLWKWNRLKPWHSPQGVTASEAVLSPDGTCAIVTPLSGVGLSHLDLAKGSVSQFSDKASVYGLSFTTDGKNVVYRESTYDNNHRRMVSVKAYDLTAGKIRTLVLLCAICRALLLKDRHRRKSS